MSFVVYQDYVLLDNSRSSFLSPVICIILVISIVAALVVAGFFAMGKIADSTIDGRYLTVQLSGNDIIVTILDGGETSQIVSLSIYIEGTPENSRDMIIKNPQIGMPIICYDLEKDRKGYAFVIAEATFADGNKKIIDYSRVLFT